MKRPVRPTYDFPQLIGPERGTNANTEDGVCRVPLDEAGLLWDGICLTFLLVQKRLFTSYYFHHLIIEILAQQQLASRGAELINEMQVKGVQEQRAADKEIMEKIKRKMDKIRAAQQRVRGHEYGEPQTHFQALRSGDYYFFEDFADMDIDLEVETKKQKTDEEDADVKFRGLNALLTNAMRTRTIKGAQETARRGSQEFTEDYGELDATPLSTSHPAPTQISDTAVISSVEASTSGAVPSSNELFQAAPQVHPATETPTERTEQRNTEDEFLLASEAKRTLPNEDTLTDKLTSLLNFTWALLDSTLISATAKLNSVSKHHRYVARKLSDEKRVVKEKVSDSLRTGRRLNDQSHV
ncbi:piezo-type mechanosensitive ion channel component-like [Ixodes scapularis]